MAAKGLTGQVVAAQLLDKLAVMTASESSRSTQSYANNWGNDIKVQIPDTGISIGQAYQYLAQWLGRQTHISGEIFGDGKGGIAVTARVGANASQSFSGQESDTDKLLQEAAEAVYARTQPYRYAVYLGNHGRSAESEATYRALIASGSKIDHAWADVGLSTLYQGRGDFTNAIRVLRDAIETRPDFVMGYGDLANDESALTHDEAVYQAEHKMAELTNSGQVADIDPRGLAFTALQNRAGLANSLGDYGGQIAVDRQAASLPDFLGQVETLRVSDLTAYAFLHDAAGLKRVYDGLAPTAEANVLINRRATMLTADFQFERWRTVKSDIAMLKDAAVKFGPAAKAFVDRVMAPLDAAASAMLGDFKTADAEIARTPPDCDLCLRMRGRIAAAEHRWTASAYWFARLSAHEPSIPFPDSDWGMMLLAKGDRDGAIAKFEIANKKGPHFADPLEMWGEALMAKNRSDLALAKFADAAHYAPNWGRLHLKWGEALVYAGKPGEAKTQFAIAGRLDLSEAEKPELARMSHG
jgi:tetratricopeptide (TPR) repeat protein